MSTVAEQLRTTREARKLTINQVAETTKIRTDHIRALESGNYDVFSAPVYIRGFVRVYAQMLKLNAPQVMSDLDAELALTEKFHEPPPLTNQPKGVLNFLTLQLSKVNWRRSVTIFSVLFVIIAIVVIASYLIRKRNSNPLADLPPAVYQPTQPGSGEVLPLPSTPAKKK